VIEARRPASGSSNLHAGTSSLTNAPARPAGSGTPSSAQIQLKSLFPSKHRDELIRRESLFIVDKIIHQHTFFECTAFKLKRQNQPPAGVST
jgi:hypothetical protein